MTRSAGIGVEAPATDSRVLSVDNLTVALPEGGDREFAVSGISFQAEAGETICLVGESGSGKSVIAQAIMGMLPRELPVASGAVRLQGDILPPQRSPAFNSIRSRRMAMIFQDAAASLDPVQRVGRQLEEILEVHGVPRPERRKQILAMLCSVRLDHPERMFRAYPHQLSGGQAQRIVIAGALLLDPALLIADEPTTAVDSTTQASILELISSLQESRSTSVLFITHDFGVVEQVADRICVMKDGKIVEAGRAAQVLRAPHHPYTRRLLAAANLRDQMPTAKGSSEVLTAENLDLVYRYGSFLNRRHLHAVRSVSLQLKEGQTLAIVGESGSGKSSIARCLLGLEPISGGTVRFRGTDVASLSAREYRRLRARIQVVLQDPYSALNPRQRIRSVISEGPIIHGCPASEARSRTERLLEMTGLPAQAGDRYPHEFSGGQRQRICIARALAVEPEVLIADEAVSALDVSIQAQILDLFRDLQQRLGFALLFITHDLWVAAAISNEILVLKDGEVVESGTVQEVFGNPRSGYTRSLLAAAPRISADRLSAT